VIEDNEVTGNTTGGGIVPSGHAKINTRRAFISPSLFQQPTHPRNP
jgi:hypothetical protein